MRSAVFTNHVDPAISSLWDRINLAISLNCLPSDIDKESHRDIQAIKVILSARHEIEESNVRKEERNAY